MYKTFQSKKRSQLIEFFEQLGALFIYGMKKILWSRQFLIF